MLPQGLVEILASPGLKRFHRSQGVDRFALAGSSRLSGGLRTLEQALCVLAESIRDGCGGHSGSRCFEFCMAVYSVAGKRTALRVFGEEFAYGNFHDFG
ncbi:MAG TPA: hypothetical protein DIU35_09920, partial [Candidatus Latescibacteria bacterium]|nr:hypothetical protein [Candidatus Latescibacterota bacterium]